MGHPVLGGRGRSHARTPERRRAALRKAARACDQALIVQTACERGEPPTVEHGRLAARVVVTALESFEAGGFGLSTLSVDSDPDLIQEDAIGVLVTVPAQ